MELVFRSDFDQMGKYPVYRVSCLPTGTLAFRACGKNVKRGFPRECHGFLLEFLKLLLCSAYAKSRLASCLSCFSPDTLLQDDEAYTVQLFQCFRPSLHCLSECDRLTTLDCESPCIKFELMTVELRGHNQRVITSITNRKLLLFLVRVWIAGLSNNLEEVGAPDDCRNHGSSRGSFCRR